MHVGVTILGPLQPLSSSNYLAVVIQWEGGAGQAPVPVHCYKQNKYTLSRREHWCFCHFGAHYFITFNNKGVLHHP